MITSYFPYYKQSNRMDCGPACLRMVAQHYGRHYRQDFLRDKAFLTREGVSLLGMGDAAEAIGMRSLGIRVPFEKLKQAVPLPCIAHWKQNHFVVVHRIIALQVSEQMRRRGAMRINAHRLDIQIKAGEIPGLLHKQSGLLRCQPGQDRQGEEQALVVVP